MPLRKTSLQKGGAPRGGAQGARNLDLSSRVGRYAFETFMSVPMLQQKTGQAVGGTDATSNLADTGRYIFEYYLIGTASDNFGPILGTDGGYDWSFGNTALGAGCEVNFGSLLQGHPRTYVPSQEDSFARILVNVEDASGADLFFGFRKVGINKTDLTDITDVAGIRILGNDGSTDANFSIITNLNNAGATDITVTTTTVTGLEDGVSVELEVRNVGGKAFFYVNGAPVSGAPVYTYDSGDYVTPIFRALQTTDVSGTIKTLAFECGLVEERLDATLISVAGATA